jgi:hypothetical protein
VEPVRSVGGGGWCGVARECWREAWAYASRRFDAFINGFLVSLTSPAVLSFGIFDPALETKREAGVGGRVTADTWLHLREERLTAVFATVFSMSLDDSWQGEQNEVRTVCSGEIVASQPMGASLAQQ